MTPPDFIIAKVCFVSSAVILLVKVAHWLINANAKRVERMVLTFIIFGVVGVVLVEGWLWVKNREHSFPISAHSAPPETKNEPSPLIYTAFQEAYKVHKEKLGQPKEEAEILDTGYFAQHQNAWIIWNQNDAEFYQLNHNKEWKSFPDKIDNGCSWYSDEANRKRFGTPKGFDPPWGGVARLWAVDKNNWKWIGWREWHCNYPHAVTHIQRFDRGLIIGAFRRYPLDKSGAQVFVLTNDQKWDSKVSFPREGSPACADPVPDPNCVPGK